MTDNGPALEREWLWIRLVDHTVHRLYGRQVLGENTINLPLLIKGNHAVKPLLMIAGMLACQYSVSLPVEADDRMLPDATSVDFCMAVQEILAGTGIESVNTIFDNMPDYRSSKPAPEPLLIYQVVTYDEKRPVMVSCKVKAADHIRAVYGEDAAGEQGICADIAQLVRTQAIAELEVDNPDNVVAKAKSFVIERNEPYTTGRNYLADFQLSFEGDDGNIHFNAPGLQVNWDDWKFWIMPNVIRGQTYCHIPTVSYMKAVATGAVEPGTIMTTADDAPTRPF